MASGNFPLLRNVSITIKAVEMAKRIHVAFQKKVNWEEFLPGPACEE